MLKDQLFKTSGLQFDNWLSGPEKFRDFRETGPWPQLFEGWIELSIKSITIHWMTS